MSTVAVLSVSPVIEGSMAKDVARAIEALEDFDVRYETNAMGTVIEADDPDEVFAAAAAAHNAVDRERVVSSLKVDDKRNSDAHAEEKVAAVEAELGRAPRSEES